MTTETNTQIITKLVDHAMSGDIDCQAALDCLSELGFSKAIAAEWGRQLDNQIQKHVPAMEVSEEPDMTIVAVSQLKGVSIQAVRDAIRAGKFEGARNTNPKNPARGLWLIPAESAREWKPKTRSFYYSVIVSDHLGNTEETVFHNAQSAFNFITSQEDPVQVFKNGLLDMPAENEAWVDWLNRQ